MTTTTVRIAVARFEFTPSMPTLARIEVSAAKTADSNANNNHINFASIKIVIILLYGYYIPNLHFCHYFPALNVSSLNFIIFLENFHGMYDKMIIYVRRMPFRWQFFADSRQIPLQMGRRQGRQKGTGVWKILYN
ncbi:hypothetical protein BRYFOR_08331 [Marvinbryantia formatexigens DSM 14469]|uniref:Uncharacterized protein n=1 Tax=Marvinbryantia formatexigens DSM 14469 TaxID=478749 RepID=C6LI61_9FIRM|nr:hypothetical protein BRYFOR_08331 [Marvinbryantia formatexigens DSM 14469]